jgi:acyl-CoA synthetase (AMP-forming)/AMP-acid ligase II
MQPQFSLFHQLAEHQARVRADKIALKFGAQETTYAEFYLHARRVASGLSAAGVRRGDRIVYLAKNNACYYEVLFGAALIGATLVPINWRLAPPEVSWIVRDARPAFGFISTLFANLLGPEWPQVCHLEPDAGSSSFAFWRDRQDADRPISAGAPDDVVVQLYTSGTTGRPKGAMLSQRAMLVFRSLPPHLQPEWNRWTDDDVSLIVMPQFHVGGTGFGVQTLCAGATGLVIQDFDAESILRFIEEERLSKIFTVPSALQMLLRHPRARDVDYRRIRTIVYGASPIPLGLLREAMEVFKCGFVQQYGMTEAGGTICVLPPEEHLLEGSPRMLSAGRALAGVEITIVRAGGTAAPAGEIGEIAIRSPTLMTGYWNRAEDTQAAFTSDGFFLSGDAGRLDADGYLYIQDRIKNMIVSGGENVYPAEVEAVLREFPGIVDAAVIGVPDETWGEAVKAIVVLERGATADAAGILRWARGRLAGYKLPKSVDFRAELPRNAAGKILHRELREPFWAGRERRVN